MEVNHYFFSLRARGVIELVINTLTSEEIYLIFQKPKGGVIFSPKENIVKSLSNE